MMEGYKSRNIETTEKISQYQEKYIPSSLRSQKKVNFLIAAGLDYLYTKDVDIGGMEYLPATGPFIVVSNHFNVKETEILLATLKNYDAHIVAAEKVHGEHPVRKIGLSLIRAITAPETLSHLSEDQKQELVGRIPDTFIKEKYQEVIDAEASGKLDTSGLLKFIRSSTALLSRGDVLIIYPEGLWLYDGDNNSPRSHSLYKGYSGFELIAEQYKKLTGETVPIIPTAVFMDEQGRKKVTFAPALDAALPETQTCMEKIAEMLPESQRGHYATKQVPD